MTDLVQLLDGWPVSLVSVAVALYASLKAAQIAFGMYVQYRASAPPERSGNGSSYRWQGTLQQMVTQLSKDLEKADNVWGDIRDLLRSMDGRLEKIHQEQQRHSQIIQDHESQAIGRVDEVKDAIARIHSMIGSNQ